MNDSSTQFLTAMLTNNDFCATVTQKSATDPSSLESFLSGQDMAIDPDDLARTRQNLAETDIRLWAGVYTFNSPESLKDKKLKITPKTGTATMDDTSITITHVDKNEFSWLYQGNTIQVTFSDHIDDDGSVAANTFAGKMTIPPANPDGASTEKNVDGEQILYSEDIPWHELQGLEQAALIATLIGVLPVIYSVGKWIKKKCASPEVADRFEHAQRDAEALEMRNLGDYGKQQLNGAKDVFMREFKTHFSTRARNIVQDEDIPGDGVDARVDQVTETLNGEVRDYLKTKLRELVREPIIAALRAQTGFEGIDGVFQIRDEVLDAQIDGLVESARVQLDASHYLRDCVRSGVQDARIHRLRTQATEIVRRKTENSQAQEENRGALADNATEISRLQEQLAQCEEAEDRERIRAQIRTAEETKAQLEETRDGLAEQQQNLEDESARNRENTDSAQEDQSAADQQTDRKAHDIHFE